jgi:acetyltransferase
MPPLLIWIKSDFPLRPDTDFLPPLRAAQSMLEFARSKIMYDFKNGLSETLNDGSRVVIRPISAADAELEREFIENLSPDSRRQRFLNHIKHPTPELIRQLTDIDQLQHVALMALVEVGGQQRAVGVSRYVLDDDGHSGECALVVADDWRNRGLGTLLMARLLEIARSRKIKKLYSIDSSENFRIQSLVKRMGFQSHLDPRDATQIVHTKYLG